MTLIVVPILQHGSEKEYRSGPSPVPKPVAGSQEFFTASGPERASTPAKEGEPFFKAVKPGHQHDESSNNKTLLTSPEKMKKMGYNYAVGSEAKIVESAEKLKKRSEENLAERGVDLNLSTASNASSGTARTSFFGGSAAKTPTGQTTFGSKQGQEGTEPSSDYGYQDSQSLS